MRALYPDAGVFADRTGRGPRKPSELRELLRTTRADGFAREEGEVTAGTRSVGVAVHDHAGWPVAALAVTWPEHSPHDPLEIAAQITAPAAELARRIGVR